MSGIKGRITVKKAVALLFLGFVLMLAARFAYSYLIPPGESGRFRRDVGQWMQKWESSRRRICQSNLRAIGVDLVAMPDAFQKGALARLQVLEEAATIAATSTSFEKDKEKFLAIVNERKGKTIYEKTQGLAPNRSLNITIGVNEQLFHDTLRDMKSIGKIVGFDVTRIDRTEEFRSLFAKKQSTEKHLETLTKLRGSSAQVDIVALEDKILAIDREIMNMGMQLGDFTPVESLSSISYSLMESQGIPAYTLDQRFLDTIVWSVLTYSYVAGVIVLICLVHRSIVVLKE